MTLNSNPAKLSAEYKFRAVIAANLGNRECYRYLHSLDPNATAAGLYDLGLKEDARLLKPLADRSGRSFPTHLIPV
ncbi:hypothetical protein HZC07_05710 [Candidatus Micrarchaeota archaeon]|nr:hypothetical protein [Candidatus Micrarchaeota archaeon]